MQTLISLVRIQRRAFARILVKKTERPLDAQVNIVDRQLQTLHIR